MDNQQAKVSDIELGWLLGIIDGEGNLGFQSTIRRPVKGGMKNPSPRIRITMTDVPSLRWIEDLLARLHLPYHVEWRYPINGDKPSWTVGAVGFRRALRWLEIITPLLKTKRREAEILYDYTKYRLSQSQKSWTDKDEEFIRLWITEIGPRSKRNRLLASQTTRLPGVLTA